MSDWIILIGLLFIVSSCKAENIDFRSMDSVEKKYNERQQAERVAHMSLDTMFSNQKVQALAEMAGKGKVKGIERLVSKGIDVNSQGNKGATPLFWSLRQNNLEGFNRLLELGADPNLIFGGSSVVHWASRIGDISFLRSALKHGGNPNLTVGKFQETPIFKTIGIKGNDNQAAMYLLLDSGSDINAVTGGEKVFGVSMGGKTPVMIAADLARFDIVFKLLERGARYDLKDDNGKDLKARALSKKGRFPSGSEQEKVLGRVINFLSQKGV